MSQHKKSPTYVLVLLLLYLNFWAPWRASLRSINAAALLEIKPKLSELRHEGALTTEQFELLKARMKDAAVAEQFLGLLNQAWALRCDSTLDEGEYAEDTREVTSEIPPPSWSNSTSAIPTLASQAHSVPPATPAAAAS